MLIAKRFCLYRSGLGDAVQWIVILALDGRMDRFRIDGPEAPAEEICFATW